MEPHDATRPAIERYIASHASIDLREKEPEFDSVLRVLQRFRRIDGSLDMLEVGTGVGWALLIAQRRGLRLSGLEVNPRVIEAAREYGRRHGVEPDIIQGNVETADLGESVYDIIICRSVFEHVEDWRRGLQNVFRALKPGGLFFFESTNKWSLRSAEYPPLYCYGWLPDRMRYRLRIMMEGPDVMRSGIDFHQFTYRRLARAFREVGFSRSWNRVELADPAEVEDRWRARLLRLCKRNTLVRTLVLTFFEVTTFVCQK